MAIQEIISKAPTQTVAGQPTNAEANETVEAGDSETVDTNTANTEVPNTNSVTPTDAETTQADKTGIPVDVEISPQALRQITALSVGNRKLKQQLAELEAKVTASAQPADITAQLKELEQLREIVASPRKYLAHTKRSLENIAEDVLSAADEAKDPRVDTLNPVIEDLRKEVAELKTSRATETEQAVKARGDRAVSLAQEHVKQVIAASPTRWESLATDDAAAKAAVEASMLVVQRDYKDAKTGQVKDISRETAQKILEDCLDEAEALALARKTVAARKNTGGQSTAIPLRKGGIELREREQGSPLPKPTIDATRGPTRTVKVARGPTDVRTARARAMKIATDGE